MSSEPKKTIDDLIGVLAALRTPVTGCPWDLEQDFASIAPYTIEEAYEVADAIARGDLADLEEELGDLLLQVVYHARMADEQGAFDFGDVAHAITTKMIRRHPHVFGDAAARSRGVAAGFWEEIKAQERALKAAERARLRRVEPVGSEADSMEPAGDVGGLGTAEAAAGLLSDVPVGLPGLTRAIKLQERAARVGFDWPDLSPVLGKIEEELGELKRALAASPPAGDVADAETAEEFGDLLFVMANLARHLKIDPETALRAANQKFVRRFSHIEARLAADGRRPEQSTLEEMDRLWDEAKGLERKPRD